MAEQTRAMVKAEGTPHEIPVHGKVYGYHCPTCGRVGGVKEPGKAITCACGQPIMVQPKEG